MTRAPSLPRSNRVGDFGDNPNPRAGTRGALGFKETVTTNRGAGDEERRDRTRGFNNGGIRGQSTVYKP